MRKINIFIAEDDVFISDELKDLLLDMNYSVVRIGYDYASSIEIINQSEIDIAILDIKMHGKDQGFQIAEYLKENKNIPIVFLTSFSDQKTVEEAVQYDPKGYIVKPFKSSDIYTTLEVVKLHIQKPVNTHIINTGRGQVLIDPDKIQFIRSDDKYIEIFVTDNRYVERDSLNNFLERVNTDAFMRIHRSYIINKNHIKSITSDAVFIGNNKIPLSRKHKEELKKQLSTKNQLLL